MQPCDELKNIVLQHYGKFHSGEQAQSIQDTYSRQEGVVIIGKVLKKHLKDFLHSKKSWGEPMGDDVFLLLSERKESFTTRGLQLMFKRIEDKAGLPGYFVPAGLI